MYTIADEALIINNFMERRKIHLVVLRARSTPGYWLYGVALHDDEDQARVYKALDNLERVLNNIRYEEGVIGIEGDTVIRFAPKQRVLEINRPAPQTFLWNDFKHDNDPLTAEIGHVFTTDKNDYTQLWDLRNTNETSVLVAGTTGSGKTNTQMVMLASLMWATSPALVSIHALDMKGSTALKFIAYAPHVISFVRDINEAALEIESFYLRMRERYDSGNIPPMHEVLAIDEIASITQMRNRVLREKTMFYLEELGRQGREANMHIIAGTQYPTVDVLGPQLKRQLGVRVVGSLLSKDESNVALGLKDGGAEKLPKKGAFIWRSGATLRRLQVPFLDDPAAVMRAVRHKWFDVIVVQPVKKQVEVPEPKIANVQPAIIVDGLLKVFQEFTDEYGNLARGGMVAALRVLHGDAAPKQGKAYQDKSRNVLKMHRAYLTSLPSRGENGRILLEKPTIGPLSPLEVKGSEASIYNRDERLM